MRIKIPIPGAEIAGSLYAIEFDTDKIDSIELASGIAHEADVNLRELTGRTKLILEFAEREDAPRWVKREGASDGT